MPRNDGPYEEAGERARLEAKAAAAKALNESARTATAEALSKIDQLARTKTKRTGDRGIK